MAEKSTALIISGDRQFILKFEIFFDSSIYVVKSYKLPQSGIGSNIDSLSDCYVIDNREGNFPYPDFINLINARSSQIFVINVGKEPPQEVRNSIIVFNLQSDNESIPIPLLLKNASRVLKYRKAQAELGSMLLHDIRAPLNSLIGYLELLINETFGALNEGQVNILGKAMEMGDATLDMLEDLSETFRGEQNAFALQKQPFDFEKTLETVLVNVWVKADRKNIKIKKTISPDFKKLLGDDYQIQRVLTNIITNAIKYSPENSQLLIEAEPFDSGYAKISVKDEGSGVPEEQLHHLFDKYFRVQHKQDIHKGYGLGLYIAKKIVRAHYGKIWAENNSTGGLTVSFTLPFAEN